jgi:hypothetical protein
LQGRGVRPGGHLDPDNCIALCRQHHSYVTDHPAKARIAGLRYESWEQLPAPTGSYIQAPDMTQGETR